MGGGQKWEKMMIDRPLKKKKQNSKPGFQEKNVAQGKNPNNRVSEEIKKEKLKSLPGPSNND